MTSHEMSMLTYMSYSSREIKSLSVKEVSIGQSFDILGHPNEDSFYDPAFGPLDERCVCSTCGMNGVQCPGHMGHINLPLTVFNPLFFQDVSILLRSTCFNCCHLFLYPAVTEYFCAQMRALNHGMLFLLPELNNIWNHHFQIQDRKPEHINMDEFSKQCNDCIEQGLKEFESTSDAVRHIAIAKQELKREFLANGFIKKKRCPVCAIQRRCLYAEDHSRMYFKVVKSDGKAKKMAEKMKKKVKEKEERKSRHDVSESDSEVEVDEETKKKEEVKEIKEFNFDNTQFVNPNMARQLLRKIWPKYEQLFALLFGMLTDTAKMSAGENNNQDSSHPTDLFFLDVIPVAPTNCRPVMFRGGEYFDNPQVNNLKKVISSVETVKNLLKEKQMKDLNKTVSEELSGAVESTSISVFHAWQTLQHSVNSVMDGTLGVKNKKDVSVGIRQILEKKEGLFRMHMMGKRVDFAARSVISPDPYINTNEIGIPLIFAKKLTYPQPVTPFNFHELRQAVINGPDEHPGACFIVNEKGMVTSLSKLDRTAREALANRLLTNDALSGGQGSKKVLRHLKNGDVLLLNRQPTLHRPSIQAHKARVLPGERTLRLHYANCKAYNADFDGDEMNAHFPQDELSRAEAYNLMATDYQYLVPKDGTPLAGLIQDHMVSGVLLTVRGRFFNKHDYQQLVLGGLTDSSRRIKLLPPCIIKPRMLWSGKQVLSTVLLNVIPKGKEPLNLTGKSKISEKTWINSPITNPNLYRGESLRMCESEVYIRDGELLCGVLDKGHYGATSYGLVHCVYQLYGGPIAGTLLSCLARLFTVFLQLHGFSLGVEDILVTSKANKKRVNIMKRGQTSGPEVIRKAFPKLTSESTESDHVKYYQSAHHSKDDIELKELDLAMKNITNELQNQIVEECMPLGLEKKFPHNNLQCMVQSGAKGSTVNAMQISCLLGQIELEGRRPPLMLSGRALPSFREYDSSPRAGGFIDGRFLTGILPQEYFFHCMAGREGLIDTAVKTSRSGYLQRCMIKHLEGISVAYDMTVRESDGSVIQFQYGEDGLDVNSTSFLNDKQFPFFIHNKNASLTETQVKDMKSVVDTQKAKKLWKQYKKWSKQSGQSDVQTPFLRFCQENWEKFSKKAPPNNPKSEDTNEIIVSHIKKYACRKWKKLSATEKLRYAGTQVPDPVTSVLRPELHFAAVSEKFHEMLHNYLADNPQHLLKDDRIPDSSRRSGIISKDRFKDMMHALYLKSLVQPGEGVGSIAAQSIGEPSTQMTLNTFHFAGRGDMNVTLGIPRLREILTVAPNVIQTPNMDIPVLNTAKAKKAVKKLQRKLNRVTLANILEDVNITEILEKDDTGDNCYKFTFQLNFLPKSQYADKYCVDPASVMPTVELKFFDRLYREIIIKLAKSSDINAKKFLLKEKKKPAKNADIEEELGDLKKAPLSEEFVEDSDSDYGDEAGAGDAMRRQRHADDVEYEGEDEEFEEMYGEGNDESEDDGEDLLEDGEEHQVEEDTQLSNKEKADVKKKETRIRRVLLVMKSAEKYDYDSKGRWCNLVLRFPLQIKALDVSSMFQTIAEKFVVHEVPGITRAILTEKKETKVTHLITEGTNMLEICKHSDILDISMLYTNDIRLMANTYGVEAACRVLVKECRDVFRAYGINVDYRHLCLIADYMMFSGTYLPCNRMGIKANPSPLQKMTFETCMNFLKEATLGGLSDDLSSPSARIITGKLVRLGTGSFELVKPIPQIQLADTNLDGLSSDGLSSDELNTVD